jgi:hypothetical protein
MKKYFTRLTALLVISAAFMAARSSTSGQSQSAPGERSKFLGTWKLISTEEKLKDGSVRPYKFVGAHGLGYLMYAADGHRCGELMNVDRPRWDDPPTAAQKIAAIDGLAAYCGRSEIDEANQVMWHYPEVAWTPDYVGRKEPRPYRIEDNRLVFSGKGTKEDDDHVERWTVVWEKMK